MKRNEVTRRELLISPMENFFFLLEDFIQLIIHLFFEFLFENLL